MRQGCELYLSISSQHPRGLLLRSRQASLTTIILSIQYNQTFDPWPQTSSTPRAHQRRSKMAKFSDLPQELRDIIWEMAIRPEGRGAHFFTVHHARKDTHLAESSWPVNISTEGPEDYFPGTSMINFAAPRCGPDGSFSWILGNPSTYIEDSALWTTCWDSRRHMIRRFRPAETGRRILPEYSWERYREVIFSDDATMTAVLQADNGEPQYFTIQPLRDLIIIEIPPDSCFSWDRAINNEPFPPIIDDLWKSFSWSALLSWRWSRYGVVCAPRNVAINFDAKWLDQTEKYLTLFKRALKMREVYTL